ncbi:MAG: hypothetical protein H6924_05710 [Alphaproteobacteria bacterium]|nr:hypothetical protein [Alphaproteobacteria bacterium]
MTAQPSQTATLLSFPRPRAHIGAALKRHRLPEGLAAMLARESEGFAEVSAYAALAYALDQRIAAAPLDLERARGILLVGPAGSGKSTVAAKICHAAALVGRKTNLARADGALGLFRTGTNPPDVLMVMEADGFNPLNARAAAAFSALGDIPGVETVGVISALSDAEDIADLVAAFHFRRVIVTNLDRTRRLGALLAAGTSGAQLAHVCASPHADEALETLEPGALAKLLLDSPAH